MTAAADEVWQVGHVRAGLDVEPDAEVVQQGDAELAAGFSEDEEGVTAVASGCAFGTTADMTLGDLAADIVFGTVRMERNFRAVEYQQQFGSVGVQPL